MINLLESLLPHSCMKLSKYKIAQYILSTHDEIPVIILVGSLSLLGRTPGGHVTVIRG